MIEEILNISPYWTPEKQPKKLCQVPETQGSQRTFVMDIFERLESAPLPFFAIDLDQSIIFWNPRAERILGYEPKHVLGCKCH